jgi:hypothetical protein
MIEGVAVAELVRRLHERDAFAGEIAERPIQEVRRGNVIGVEDGDEISARDGQRGVEVTGLRSRVLVAREIAATELAGKRTHRGAIAVVEQPRFVRVAQRARGGQGAPHDLRRLVDRRHEHVDAQSGGRRRLRAMRQADRREQEQQRACEADSLHGQDEPAEHRMARIDDAAAPREIDQRRAANEREQCVPGCDQGPGRRSVHPVFIDQ